jgi:hypothetical protein
MVFLISKWRSEFHCLRDHGRNIYKEEDRADGREILRALKQQEDEVDGQADYNFTHGQSEVDREVLGQL